MQSLTANSKQKRSSKGETYTQYLILPSEPKDVTAASRGSFGFRNRYLVKRRMMRTIRKLRREQV